MSADEKVWDSLAEDVRRDRDARRCSVSLMMDAHIPVDAYETVDDVLRAPNVSHAALYRALVVRLGRDKTPSVYALRWHRTGQCNCWKVDDDA